ncbi:MAG: hypothetical protein IJM82_01155 [Synergistaceae bacterium]|nr:hypothetical protein [Synergistaceae bacterium]MBQ7067754.1 hypothetical protein [Synergistaceae bacterium]MBR0076204.1 hypothetical protein [Synergistaceae bacterium]MBR0079320.1 hypothetical protein [Synergistaceae bacterium]
MRAVKILLVVSLFLIASVCYASEAVPDPDLNGGSSRQMMEQIEKIIYGYVAKGGLIERLSKVEEDLFGRSLPGTIAERHAAILNFLDTGTEDQPSMLFKLGVAEWVVDKKINASEAAIKRLEALETNLTGSSRGGSPIVMRVESLLAALVMDPITSVPVNVPANTVMKFRFMDELSPAISKAGDFVRLELTDDLIVNQHLVAPAGSLLITQVREVKRPRMFGVPGEVRLSFEELKPLGPQKPKVTVGEAAQNAIKEARKVGARGEGAIVGAGAVSIAGAALLGPVGLVSGVFIRGNSIKIAAGSVTFLQTSEDCVVSSYPIPASLQKVDTSISVPETQASQQQSNYDPNRDTIIKRDVFNRNAYGEPTNSGTVNTNAGGDFELPPEQQVN